MSVEATAAMASAPETQMVGVEVANDASKQDAHDAHDKSNASNTTVNAKSTGLHSPPDSNSAMKLDSSDESELSDLDDPSIIDINMSSPRPTSSGTTTQDNFQPEEEEDIGEVLPDHWSGTVPVFKPNMNQFKDFKKFMTKIDCYGMKSGIVKIIPPQEWKDNHPPLDDMIKQIRVKEPIKQDIMGSNGTYRQVNILHQRSYNIPQWRKLCDQSEHQPPARRGERRAQAPPKPKPVPASNSNSRRRRSTRGKGKRAVLRDNAADPEDRPITPVSPKPNEDLIESVEQDPGTDVDDDDDPPVVGRMGGSRQAKPKTQSTSARRKYARREASARIDEEAFKNFDYHMDISDYTPERCEELERIYWKTLTYAPPLYGADLPGTLFDEDCNSWNLNKLPNLLDVLGTKVPGVNTAYLYLGMWKATFAWHLEDVDLYSINYLHFGAPKQWYSISQGDARRFEAAMKSIWPTEAKACDQFLRHKAFLISPNHLLQYYNIKVNKCVSYPGEFVVTYPYGYHSGYNLGYNCAEAVNFALDSWLPMGKIAKRCECAQAQDSVWVDVYEIERKLRGEETEYEETEDEEEEEEEEEEDADTGVPTPILSHVRVKQPGRKRKRAATDKGEKKGKKIRLRVKNNIEPPCCLCPHDIPGQEVLPTSDGRKAHRICALYSPETWVETVEGEEVVANVDGLSKSRMELKCLYCRSKRGACIQCSQKKCARPYHATCAAAAGVLVEEADVPIFGEDGTEYKEQAFEFSCRFHRTKRDRKLDGEALDECQKTRQAAAALKKGDICQLQYYRGDIFAGVVVENRPDERAFLLDIIPHGERVEVEWKWLLLPDPADFHLQRASANAIPMPTSRKAKDQINATKRVTEELPRAEAPFVDGFTWAEFNTYDCTNQAQAKVDLSKDNQLWHYIGRTSTEARAQYTEDPRRMKHNPKSNFLDTLPRPPPPVPQPRRSYGPGPALLAHTQSLSGIKPEKPYQYRPRDPITPYARSPFADPRFAPNSSTFTTPPYVPNHSLYPHEVVQPTAPKPNLVFAHMQLPPPPKQAPTPKPAPAVEAGPQQNGQYVTQKPVQKLESPQQAGYYFQPPVGKPVSAGPLDNQRHSQQTAPSSTTAASLPHPHQYSHQAISNSAPIPQPHDQLSSQQTVPTPTVTSQQSSQYSSPQALSKPLTKSRPTPPQNGHRRSRSSLGGQNSQSLVFGSDNRFRTPPFSYGTSRMDSTAKSPFSHGFMQPPGLGPSPSPQNGQLFQAQARARSCSLASNRSFDMPMTSSAIRPSSATRPSSSASAQGTVGEAQSPQQQIVIKPRPNIVQKYAFFQVHHNRDSTKYRTPYAHWGGFTNGYEGNLRAHLMRSPEVLFDIRRRSTSFSMTPSSLSPTAGIPFSKGTPTKDNNPNLASRLSSYGSARQQPNALSPSILATQKSTASMPPRGPDGNLGYPQGSSKPMNTWQVNPGAVAQLHPAIRAQYAAMLQTGNAEAHSQKNITHVPGMPNSQSVAAASTYSQATPNSTFRHTSISNVNLTLATTDSTSENQKPLASTAPNTFFKGLSVLKQTYVPPPRPWETLRKAQASAEPSPAPNTTSAEAVASTLATLGSMTSTSVAPSSDICQQQDHMMSPELESSNGQLGQPRSVSLAHVKQGTTQSQGVAEQSPAYATQQPAVELSAATIVTNPSISVSPLSQPEIINDLPEVPDESMKLIESIIWNARRVSDTYSDDTTRNT